MTVCQKLWCFTSLALEVRNWMLHNIIVFLQIVISTFKSPKSEQNAKNIESCNYTLSGFWFISGSCIYILHRIYSLLHLSLLSHLWNHFSSFISMEKRIKNFWVAGFFLPTINATVFSQGIINRFFTVHIKWRKFGAKGCKGQIKSKQVVHFSWNCSFSKDTNERCLPWEFI